MLSFINNAVDGRQRMIRGASLKHFFFSSDSWLWRPNRPLLYWITTTVFLLAIGGTVWDILEIDFQYSWKYSLPGGYFESSSSPTDGVYIHANGARMVRDLQSKMPVGVQLEGSLPVFVNVDRSTVASKVLSRLTVVPMDLLILAIIWLFRRLALTAIGTREAPANPFIWGNVRRLRIIATLVMALPVIDAWSGLARTELVSGTLKEFTMYSWYLPNFLFPFGLGLMLAVLAEVFAAGIRLREDVEGLV
jgi:Protein of unknown function (DUF2975)